MPDEILNALGGIYIHIPFCIKKCLYCDFFSVSRPDLIKPFVKSLLKEMKISGAIHRQMVFDTIYLGGGTPSSLPPFFIYDILCAAHKYFHLEPHGEITMEANPGTLNYEKLLEYKKAGVNRINLGIQSFNDEFLKMLGRIHDSKEAKEAALLCMKAGFENIGFDFIYGLPGQSVKIWVRDLHKAINLNPRHLSCYMLTIEPGTPLFRLKEKGDFVPCPDKIMADLFNATIDYLGENGYEQYEISNFAYSENKRSRHNQKYWNFSPYLGFGPSAHSFVNNERSWNFPSVTKYIKIIEKGKLPLEGKEILTKDQQITEAVYLGLRKKEGILIREFEKRFDMEFEKLFGAAAELLEKEGFLGNDAGRFFLTEKGMIFADSIISFLISRDFS